MKSNFQAIIATYSSLETLVLATASHNLQSNLTQGEDLHKKTACAIFGLAPMDVREKHRRFAKSENYCQLYSPDFSKTGELQLPLTPTHCACCLQPLTIGCKCHEG
ncbi:DNA polymerase [Vibrio phage 29Fa.3]|nr:DNA polymerase [Vibrio phage 29Fa.3]